MSDKRFFRNTDYDGHPITDNRTGFIYTSAYKKDLIELLNNLSDQADRATPIENGKNRYGVDVAYFRKTINRELNRPLSDFRPDELARVFARLAVTADESVLLEPEFNKSKWIDVRENKPKKIDGSRILAFGGYIFECECRFDDGVGLWCSIGGDEFTHWMPLPSYPE